ncbi:MAG: hypothetical protein ACSLEW_10530 [Nocardioides sp.]
MIDDLGAALHRHAPEQIDPIDLEGISGAVTQRVKRRRAAALAASVTVVAVVMGGAVLLRPAAQTSGPTSPPLASDPTTERSTAAGDEAGRTSKPRPKPLPPQTPEYTLERRPDVAPADEQALRAFIAFAVNPEEPTASQVPFADEVSVSQVGGKSRNVTAEQAREESSWWISDGVGTTSALFVISNAFKRASAVSGGVEFVATSDAIPLCDQVPSGEASSLGRGVHLFISAAQSDCAQEFRVDLYLGSQSEIRAVALEVREP